MTQTTDAALVAGSPATDSRGNFVIPSADELLQRMKHATDRTIGIGRGVRDMRESGRTVPVTVRELKYVEAMVAQAADTIEAQARRIETLEGKRAWAEHFALMIDPTRNLAINPLYYGDPAWRWAEYAMRFVLKAPTP